MHNPIILPAALFTALYHATLSSANPLPPNVGAALPSNFVLAPLITPPPPPSPSDGNGNGASIATDGHIVRDSYIVVLKDHLEHHQIEAHHAHVHSIHQADVRLRSLKKADNLATAAAVEFEAEFDGIVHKYSVGKHGKGKKVLKGYSGKFSESTLDAIRTLQDVKFVERDSIVWASEIERGAPWGLARISHRDRLNFGTFNRYEYDANGGEGVDAYVIDTGVNIDHVEFEGRAKWGKTIPKDPDQDLNGHGSHVAGTIASAKYGVAKKATIIAVKVLGAGGSGTMSDVVAGVSWAAEAADKAATLKAQGKNPTHKGSVANMSLGGGKSPALDDAVDAAVEDGLHFAVAAGNDNKDSCSYSPAGAENAITVGASTIGDERAYFSNFGPCVDIFAPGLQILSSWNTGNTSVNTISGTSMASPHVAGLAAYFLSLYPTSFTPSEDDFTDAAYAAILGEEEAETQSFLGQQAQMVLGKFEQWSGRRNKALAPIPPKDKPLTPKALKKALAKVASKGILTGDIGTGSPNLLIFNNYTTSSIVAALKEASIEA